MIEELNGDFLQWLRGFYYVAQTGSVRKAAQLMRRNPSTISYQLRCLEAELNVILFDRVKRSLRITEEGKSLFGWTISTFEALKGMKSSISNTDGSLKGSILLAGTLPIITLAVPAIAEFIRKHPRVKLNIERGLSPDVRRIVNDSQADFGLANIPSPWEKERFEIIFKARPLLIFARDNPWRIPPVPNLEDIGKLPFIAFNSPSDTWDAGIPDRRQINEVMAKNTVLSANNYHLIMRFIWHGLGVGIMDEICYNATRFGAEWQNIAAIPLDHILPNLFYGIITRKQKRLSPPALELIKCLRTHFLNMPSLETRETWFDVRQCPGVSENGLPHSDGNGGRHEP